MCTIKVQLKETYVSTEKLAICTLIRQNWPHEFVEPDKFLPVTPSLLPGKL